jgi:hypothetical protein
MASTSGQLGATAAGGGALGWIKFGNPQFSTFGGKLQAVTGPSVILTNTSGNIGDQQGWFTNAGVSGHYVGGGSGEFQWGTGRCGQFVGNLEVGIGAGIGGEAAVGKSYTGVVWTSKPDQPCPK